MDFTLSDEQRLLKDSVDRLLADRYAFDQRKNHFKAPGGWSTAMWSQYADLGLLGLPFAEEYGGFGGGAVEIMLVMEAFGRALILEPYLATVVLGGTAVRLGASDAQKSRVLPAIADGSMKLAFAHGERQARYDVTDVMTTAKKNGNAWVLDGGRSGRRRGGAWRGRQRTVVDRAGDRGRHRGNRGGIGRRHGCAARDDA